MRTLFFSIIALIACYPVVAQLTVQPEIGVNIANYRIKTPNFTYNNLAKGLWRAGAVVNIRCSGNVEIQPGLFYTGNGYKSSLYGINEDITIHCLELPVNVLYTPETKSKNLSIGAGLYAAYHLAGAVEVDGHKTEMKFANKPTENLFFISKPYDIGWRLVSVLKITPALYAKAHFQMGLKNLYAESEMPDSYFNVRNYSYGISFGYCFNAKKGK